MRAFLATALYILLSLTSGAQAFDAHAELVAGELSARAELDRRAAAPTKTVWTTSTIFSTQTLQGKAIRSETLVYVTQTKTIVVPTTTTVTIATNRVRRTAVPEAPLDLGKRAAVTPTVTSTRYITKVVRETAPGTTTWLAKTVRVTTTVTSTNVRTALRTTFTTTMTAAKSSSTIPSSSSSSSVTPAIMATKLPVAYPEMDDPSVFKTNMLNQHNGLRAKFGVPALSWSSDLASFAQNWANSCRYYHSNSGGASVPWNAENIAYADSNSVNDLKSADSALPMDAWGVSEFKKYSFNPRSAIDDLDTAHFQNIVWRTYSQIGCAVAYCANGVTSSSGSKLSASPTLLWGCDFALGTSSSDQTPAYNVPLNTTQIY